MSSDEQDTGRFPLLNPVTLLALPDEQRQLLLLFARQRQRWLTFADVLALTDTDAASTRSLLQQLTEAGYVITQGEGDALVYRVPFGGRVSRTMRGVSETMWQQIATTLEEAETTAPALSPELSPDADDDAPA